MNFTHGIYDYTLENHASRILSILFPNFFGGRKEQLARICRGFNLYINCLSKFTYSFLRTSSFSD